MKIIKNTKCLNTFKYYSKIFILPFLCAVGAILGYMIPDSSRANFVAYSAVIFCFLLFSTTGWLLYVSIKSNISLFHRKTNALIGFSSILIISLFLTNDRLGNKVIQDELVLQASALALTYENKYRIPQFSHNLLIDFEFSGGVPDKRPPLFPFLLSVIHRILGYSQYNGFIVNSLLGIGVLFMVGKCSQLILGGWGWLMGMTAFATLPILSQNITSQHVEVLYLFLIICLFYICLSSIFRNRIEDIPLAYCLAGLIAFTRYEGLLFLIVPFFVDAYLRMKTGLLPNLKLVYLVLPLSMVFLFCLIGYVFENPVFWQLEDFGKETAFSPEYWNHNIGAMFDFLLDTGRRLPNSILLSVLGISTFPLTLLLVIRAFKQMRESSSETGKTLLIALFLITCSLFLLLIFSYHWGYVNSDVTARFMLFPYFVMLLFFLLSISILPMSTQFISLAALALLLAYTFLIGNDSVSPSLILLFSGGFFLILYILLKKTVRIHQSGYIAFFLLFLFGETIPSIAERRYEMNSIPMKRAAIFSNWIEERKGTDAVFISDSSLYGILARESSTSLNRFLNQPEVLFNLYKEKKFSNLYILQSLHLHPDKRPKAMEKWELPETIVTEEIDWKRINDRVGVRIVRVTDLIETNGSEKVSEEQSPFLDPGSEG